MGYRIDIENMSPEAIKKVVLGVLVGIAAIVLLSTTLYSVGPEEAGVIQRFGRYVRTTRPGLHGKIPFGVETAKKVKVKRIFKEEFGFKTLRSGIETLYGKKVLDESLMLTGDLNSAVVEWIVQYKIKDPVVFLFNVRNVRDAIRDISESTMRQIIGDRSVDEVLTVGRIEAGEKAQEKLQEILDSYNIGIQIVTVKLQDVNPPDEVKPAFNEVNEAKQDRERLVNEAWKEYNEAIPKAKGDAENLIKSAEGYAISRINTAQGDASLFLAVCKEYKSAREVTRRRLYLEALEEILPQLERKYVIDKEQKGLLPLLQLGGLNPKEGKE